MVLANAARHSGEIKLAEKHQLDSVSITRYTREKSVMGSSEQGCSISRSLFNKGELTMPPVHLGRETLIGKAALDEGFAKALIANPAQAIKDHNVQINEADVKRLEALSPAQRSFLVGQLRPGHPAAFYDGNKGI